MARPEDAHSLPERHLMHGFHPFELCKKNATPEAAEGQGTAYWPSAASWTLSPAPDKEHLKPTGRLSCS